MAAARFEARDRHAGHHESRRSRTEVEQDIDRVRGTYRGPLNLGCPLVRVDTSGNLDRDAVVSQVRGVLDGLSEGPCQTRSMVEHPIAAHYELGFERDRLFDEGEPRLELTRTLQLLDRFLPSQPARLIDVGGGPGAYAAVWARRGHDVHLYDLLELHVQQAQQAADAQPEHRFTAAVADARSIPEPDASADAVVLLGPLYHLTEQTQRASALHEAWRMLKPGGVVAAVGISRFAALLDGLWRGWLSDPLFREIAERDLVDGQHRNPDPVRHPQWFTTAYFHRPDELADEVKQAGFDAVSLHGIEGPGWLMREHWSDPSRREQMLFAARAVESEPSLSGLSAHLLAVGTKP